MATAKALSREKIFEIAKTLPPAPRVLTDLGVLLQDTNTDLASIAALIKRDTALAAHIIRIANSVAYNGGGVASVGTIEEAAARVGFREIYRLVGMAALGRLTERPLKFYGVPTGLLRANMLYTALACEALAEASHLDARSAYTAGLIRTLGILVLDRVAELLPSVERYNHEEHCSYARWEGLSFVFTHCEVAGMILSEWGFPEDTIEAVRKHYLLREDDCQYRLACLLNLAGGIVAVGGVSLPGEFNQWESSVRQAEILGLTPAAVHKASERARAAYAGFRSHIELDRETSEVPQLSPPPLQATEFPDRRATLPEHPPKTAGTHATPSEASGISATPAKQAPAPEPIRAFLLGKALPVPAATLGGLVTSSLLAALLGRLADRSLGSFLAAATDSLRRLILDGAAFLERIEILLARLPPWLPVAALLTILSLYGLLFSSVALLTRLPHNHQRR